MLNLLCMYFFACVNNVSNVSADFQCSAAMLVKCAAVAALLVLLRKDLSDCLRRCNGTQQMKDRQHRDVAAEPGEAAEAAGDTPQFVSPLTWGLRKDLLLIFAALWCVVCIPSQNNEI